MKSSARKKRKAPSSPTPAASSSKSVATTSKKAKHTSEVDVSAVTKHVDVDPGADADAIVRAANDTNSNYDVGDGDQSDYDPDELQYEYNSDDLERAGSTPLSSVPAETVANALKSLSTGHIQILGIPIPTRPDQVPAYIDRVRKHHNLAPVPAVFWTRVHSLTCDFLLDLIRNPFRLDVPFWLKRGVLRPVRDGEDDKYQVYLRSSDYDDPDDAIDDLKEFGCNYSADLAWVALALAHIGADSSTIKQFARRALGAKSFPSACDAELQTLFEDIVDRLACPSAPASNSSIRLPYFGFTSKTAGERHHHDGLSRSQTRYTNFLSIASRKVLLYEVRLFDDILRGVDQLAQRVDPLIGLCESIPILATRGAALNSSLGGFLVDLAFAPELYASASHALSLVQQLPFTDPVSPSVDNFSANLTQDLARDMAKLHADERQCMSSIAPEAAKMHPSAQAQQDRNAASVSFVNGHALSLHLLKAIPEEDHRDGVGSPHGASEGGAVRIHRSLRRTFYPSVPVTGPVPLEIVRMAFGGLLDFWRCILRHYWFWITLLFTSRLLTRVKPVVLIVSSNVLAKAVTNGLFAFVWTMARTEALQQFLAGTSPTTPERLIQNAGTRMTFLRGTAFLEMMGEISVRRVGHDSGDYALVVVMEHTGHDAYDPALAHYMRPVYFLCIAIHEVLCAVTRRALLSGDRLDRSNPQKALAWMLRYKAIANSIIIESGLANKLEAAKEPLRALIPALAALRKQIGTSGLEARPRAARTPGMLIPESPDGRLELAEKVLKHEREMSSYGAPPNSLKLIPGDMVGKDDKYRGWVVRRQPRVDLSLAVSGYGGTTVEGVERARRIRQANAEKLKAMSSFFREQRFKARDGETYTPAEISERDCIRRTIQKALEAFKTLEGLAASRKRRIDDAPRMGECPECHALVLGYHSNSLHHCHAVAPPTSTSISLKNFSSLVRIVRPDDLLAHPAVQAFVAEEPDLVTSYEKANVIDILRDAGIELPGVDRIPPLTATWLSEEMDWETQVYYAYQAALEQVTFGLSKFEPQHSFDINKIFKKKFDSLYKCLTGENSEVEVYAGCCPYGYRGILAAPQSKRRDNSTWKHVCPNHAYKLSQTCTPAHTQHIKSFLQLPRLAAQHAWYLFAVVKRRTGPSPLLYGQA